MNSTGVRIDHLVLMASDLGRSVAFYERVLPPLGFSLSREWVWTTADGLAIDLKKAEQDRPYARGGPGLNHFSFSATSQQTFEDILQGYAAAGLTVPAIQDFGDALSVFLPDPDGLRLELTWYRPALEDVHA